MRSHAKASSAIAVICGIVLALGASQALAAKTTVSSLGSTTTGTTGGLFSTPRGVAVNQEGSTANLDGKGGVAAGTFYVVDSANHRVQQFSPAGEFLRTWGWGVVNGEAKFQICEVASSCQTGISGPGAGQMNLPQGIAVDQATGNLYVSDQGNRRIDVFGPNGTFQGAFGYGAKTGAVAFEFCTTSCAAPAAAGGVTGFQGGRFGTAMGGLSVDPATGNLYLADKSGRRVDVFKPILSGTLVTNAEFLRAFGWDVEATTNEVQTVSVNAGAGDFKLTFNGQTTADLPYNTTAAAMQTALNALSSIAPGSVTVAGGPGAPGGGTAYKVTFSTGAAIAAKNVPEMTFTPGTTGLSGGSGPGANTATIATTTQGGGAATTFEVCTTAANCKQGAGGAGLGQFGALNAPADVAVDSEGNVYAVDSQNNKRVQKFSSAPTPLVAKFGEAAITEAFGAGELLNVAVDPSSAPNRVLVSGRRSADGNKVAILELDAKGNKLHLHGEELTPSGLTTASTGLAVAKASLGGNLYLSTATNNTLQGTYALSEGPSIQAPSGVTTSEATLNATLVSNDAKVSYRFEYMPLGGSWVKLPESDADAGTSTASAAIASTGPSTGTLTVKARGGAFTLAFNAETTSPLAHDASAAAVQAALEALPSIGAGNVAVTGGPGSPDGSTPYAISFQGALAGTEVTQISAFAANLLASTIAVSKVATGLKDGTKYLARLIATRPAGGFALSTETIEFTTFSLPPAAPSVSAATATAITDTTAKLEGKVNPDEQPTKYQFEYLTQSAYEANGNSFAGAEPAAKAPASPAPIGAGALDIAVSEQIEGLSPATTYRFRLSATNGTGTTTGPDATFVTHSQPQAFEPCPNDAFRTGPSANLPDCRAYEQASPVDKNGGSLQATAPSSATAEDGSTITFESTTGVPGGSGAQGFPTYMAKRGAEGWTTTGLLPNPSSGERAAVLGWTPDFATVFDRAQLLGGGISLLARSTASGDQATMAPHTLPEPEYAYVDSSADGRTSIFEAGPQSLDASGSLQLTPNAAAGEPNVYAWDRNDPTDLKLAGVLPDGSTPTQGSQIGEGIVAEEYNRNSGAVTEDGAVFFNATDSEGQLYLRLNPTAEETTAKDGKGNCIPDPVLACTVHISASQKKNGEGLEGRDAAGRQPAFLRAASPDGSVVTFVSSEKLTNDANTGPEPEAPAIARANLAEPPCSPAPCEEDLGFIPVFAHEIAIDKTEGYVYWSDPTNGRIGRAKLDGTEVSESYIALDGEPLGIAVINEPSAKYIFWTDRGELNEKGEPQSEAGTIGRADLDGTDVIDDCYTGLTNPRSIAATPSFVYWTMPEFSSSLANGKAGRAELDDCGDELSKNPDFIAADFDASGDITAGESHLYISSFHANLSTSFVRRFDFSGAPVGASIIDITNVNSAVGLALDDAHLYWTDPDHNKVGRSDLNGDNEEPGFIAEAGRALDPALSASALYWSTNQSVVPNPGADLYQLDRDSGLLTDLAPDSTHLNGTEVLGVLGTSEDGSYVYFAANGVPDNLDTSTNEMGEEAAPGNCKGLGFSATGTCNLYVAHEGQVDFIARLDAGQAGGEKDTGDTVNWLAGRLALERTGPTKAARVSADGEALVFRSGRQLTAYDNQGPRCIVDAFGNQGLGPCLEFYRFDYEEMDLACLTCHPGGATPEGPAAMSSVNPPNLGAPLPAATLSRNLSSDGNRFFFESWDALVAADVNGEGGCAKWGATGNQRAMTCQDVYEWEAPGTGSCKVDSPAYSPLNEGCIYLLSTGKLKEASFFADADPDGENVFIYTYEQLVPQDQDGLMDAYDVRVGGGLASQHATEPPVCAGEACRSEPIAPPSSQAPGSAGFAGPTDPQPKRAKQRKRKRKKQARQRRKRAAKAKQRARQKQRAAKQSGRAGR